LTPWHEIRSRELPNPRDATRLNRQGKSKTVSEPANKQMSHGSANWQGQKLYMNILRLTREEGEAIQSNDWEKLAQLRAEKQTQMGQAERVAIRNPETRKIAQMIVELTQANEADLRRKMDTVKESLDGIAETRRKLQTLRRGYTSQAEPRAICVDKKA